MQSLLLWKSSKYCTGYVCICSLRYPACIEHAPYYTVIYGCPDVQYFSTLSHKRHGFRKKKVPELKILVSSSSKIFVWNIFDCKKKWAGHDRKSKKITNLIHTCFILQYFYYNPLHVSSIICSSSGGWIVLMQHLVSSLSVSGRPVHGLRGNCSAVPSQPVHRTATYWEWRYQMLHQYNSTSWWWAYNARNM